MLEILEYVEGGHCAHPDVLYIYTHRLFAREHTAAFFHSEQKKNLISSHTHRAPSIAFIIHCDFFFCLGLEVHTTHTHSYKYTAWLAL